VSFESKKPKLTKLRTHNNKMASVNAQINLISQAMLNNSEQELDKLDEFKSAQSIHDAVEKGNFETFKVSLCL